MASSLSSDNPSHTSAVVQHFEEQHGGEQQQVLYRIVGQFLIALERQVWESVEIDSTNLSIGPKCLNNKTEWGASKRPKVSINGEEERKRKMEEEKEIEAKINVMEEDREAIERWREGKRH